MKKGNVARIGAFLLCALMPVSAFAQASKNPAISQGTVPWVTQLNIGGAAISTSNPVPMSIQSGGISAGTAGTPSADVLSVQGISGGVAIPFASSDAAPVTTSAVTVSGDVVTIDTAGYQSLTIQPIQYGSGSVAVTGSNDGGTTWSPVSGVLSNGQVSSSLFSGISGRYGAEYKQIKISVTAYTSGNFQFAYRLSNAPQPRVPNQIGLQAGEGHAGEVGSNVYTSTVTPTTTAVTYTVGQSAGGLLTFTNMVRVSGTLGNPGTGGAVKSAIVANKSTLSSGGWDLWLFSANPTGSTCTNASAWSLAAADIGKVVGVINFNAGNTSAAGTVFLPSSVAGNGNSSLGSGIWYTLSSSTSMYGCLVARASMAVGTTTDLSISIMTNRL